MFTGIIESTARVLTKTNSGLTVERPDIFDDLKIGCSIAVSGVCLSVISYDDRSMSFDVVPTTFEKTKLGSLKVGDSVNLERAMKADGRFDGHIVMGHSEGVGIVVVTPASAPTRLSELSAESEDPGDGPGVGATYGREAAKKSAMLTVSVPESLTPFIVLHGSITLDGVALTVAGLRGTEVTVAVIPHTLKLTTLGTVQKGDTLNVESDIVGKYILKAHGNA